MSKKIGNVEYWWDKGILWISKGDHETVALNTYDIEDLEKIFSKEEIMIEQQRDLDDLEFGPRKEM